MAYYDEFVEDPNAALDKIAGQRGMSRHELDKRVELIASEAKSGAHLTLGEVNYYIAHADNPGADLSAHVHSCTYCADMIKALLPENVDSKWDQFKEVLEKRRAAAAALASAARAQPVTAVIPGEIPRATPVPVFRWKPQFAYAAFIIALLAGNIGTGVLLVDSHHQIDALNTQVALFNDFKTVPHNYVVGAFPDPVDPTALADLSEDAVPPVVNADLLVHPASRKTAAAYVASAWSKEGPHRLYFIKPDPRLVGLNVVTQRAADHLVLADSGLTAKCIPSILSKTGTDKGTAPDSTNCEVLIFPDRTPAASASASASASK